MISILLCSLIVSLFTLGLKISTGEGMILEVVSNALNKKFIKYRWTHGANGDGPSGSGKEIVSVSKLYYPILYCIKCMPSLYGTLISLLLLPFTLHLLYQIPLIIFCSVTLNCIFYQMYE